MYRQRADYKWSGIYDNCTHTTHNAIAAAGIMRALHTNEAAPAQLFNLAVPANDFIQLARLGSDSKIDGVVSFYHDLYKRQMLMENDWMATQPGVLTETFAAYAFENSLYDTSKSNFLILDVPIWNIRHRQFRPILSKKIYSDVHENLVQFQHKYQSAFAKKRTLESLRADQNTNSRNDLDTPEFESFYAKFYAHIETALKDVEAQLAAGL